MLKSQPPGATLVHAVEQVGNGVHEHCATLARACRCDGDDIDAPLDGGEMARLGAAQRETRRESVAQPRVDSREFRLGGDGSCRPLVVTLHRAWRQDDSLGLPSRRHHRRGVQPADELVERLDVAVVRVDGARVRAAVTCTRDAESASGLALWASVGRRPASTVDRRRASGCARRRVGGRRRLSCGETRCGGGGWWGGAPAASSMSASSASSMVGSRLTDPRRRASRRCPRRRGGARSGWMVGPTTGLANLPPISARASACEARRSAGDHFQAQEPVYSVVTRPDSEGPALRVVLTSRISTRLSTWWEQREHVPIAKRPQDSMGLP